MASIMERTASTLGGLPLGTLVMTLDGALPIENLMTGDRIVTRDGARPLRGIAARVVPLARMIRVTDSALGVDRPRADTLLSEDQRVLVRDWRAMAFAGRREAMIPAHRLIDGAFVRRERCVGLRLFTLAFDAPVVVMAAGLDLCALPEAERV